MRIIRFNDISNALKVEPESFEDLYLLAIVIASGDIVESKSYRRFRPTEGDKGEQKEIFVKLNAEKVEIDKDSGRLRVSGKIIEGHPAEFVSIGSYHTINIEPRDNLVVVKPVWKPYVLKRIKQAVMDSRKPKIGIIVLDDEKATVSYIRGYGIDIMNELYSHLSKRMSQKDYEKQREQYFNDVIKAIENMRVDLVIVAGPGFTKDDVQKYVKARNIEIKKNVTYASASDAERSGVREVLRSSAVANLLEREHVKTEFEYLNNFLNGLRVGTSHYGAAGVREAIGHSRSGTVLVNDDVINKEDIREVLDIADSNGMRIEIINADDDAGIQLRNFKGIAVILGY